QPAANKPRAPRNQPPDCAIDFKSPGSQRFRLEGLPWAHLESTAIWRLESRQNPHAGKRALRGAAFPGCGLAELSSSATGARLRRTLVVSRKCQRQGFATEALNAIRSFCFDGVGLHRVSAWCDSRNIEACRLAEKVGMRREGELINA